MATSFELMDLDSGNLVGSYSTLEEALEIIRDAFAASGRGGIDDLGLARVESGGSQACIALGSELLDYVTVKSVSLQMPGNGATMTSNSDGNQERMPSRARPTSAREGIRESRRRSLTTVCSTPQARA